MADLPSSPAALRNREPIAAVLAEHLPEQGAVLEIAAGSGEHAVHLARRFPGLRWTPSDADGGALAVLAARREAEGSANLQPPVRLDVTASGWERDAGGPFDAVVCINMIHIAPWAAAEGLFDGAARMLAAGGVLFLYGPFIEDDVATAPSNLAFDASLKARDPRWGLRRLEDVTRLAEAHGFRRTARVGMPAENLSVVFRR